MNNNTLGRNLHQLEIQIDEDLRKTNELAGLLVKALSLQNEVARQSSMLTSIITECLKLQNQRIESLMDSEDTIAEAVTMCDEEAIPSWTPPPNGVRIVKSE